MLVRGMVVPSRPLRIEAQPSGKAHLELTLHTELDCDTNCIVYCFHRCTCPVPILFQQVMLFSKLKSCTRCMICRLHH